MAPRGMRYSIFLMKNEPPAKSKSKSQIAKTQRKTQIILPLTKILHLFITLPPDYCHAGVPI